MLYEATGRLTYDVIQLARGSAAGETLHFFLYDTIKLLVLLFGMISLVGTLRTFLPRQKITSWLTRTHGTGHLMASLFGAVTPFCSCSSIPIFFGLLKTGIPLGVTFSFLITSPLVNQYLVVIMLGMFGWKITALYVLSGVGIGVASGLILSRMRLERFLMPGLVPATAAEDCECAAAAAGWRGRLAFGVREAAGIVRKVWLWVVLGVGVGALMHNYVPQALVERAMARSGVFSVPLAALLGVPMYGSCAAIVPIALVLFRKGIPLGTALAFMMAVAALSLPEAIILRRAMRLRLILIFFGITALAIIVTGYVFNMLQGVVL